MARRSQPPGQLIAFEGFDGSGKSMLAQYVADRYGFTPLKSPPEPFKPLRDWYDENRADVVGRALFYASANVLQSLLAEQALAMGQSIVFDRYYPSTLAAHQDLPADKKEQMEHVFAHLVQPDLWFYIEADFATIWRNTERRRRDGLMTNNDTLVMTPDMHDQMTQIYHKWFANRPHIVLDGSGSKADLQMQVDQHLQRFLKL